MKQTTQTQVIKLHELKNFQIVDREGKPAPLCAIAKMVFYERSEKAQEIGKSTGDTSELDKLSREIDYLISQFGMHLSFIVGEIMRIEEPEIYEQYDKELSKVVRENMKRRKKGASVNELLPAPISPIDQKFDREFQRWIEKSEPAMVE
jgi:hypothetical protein